MKGAAAAATHRRGQMRSTVSPCFTIHSALSAPLLLPFNVLLSITPLHPSLARSWRSHSPEGGDAK